MGWLHRKQGFEIDWYPRKVCNYIAARIPKFSEVHASSSAAMHISLCTILIGLTLAWSSAYFNTAYFPHVPNAQDGLLDYILVEETAKHVLISQSLPLNHHPVLPAELRPRGSLFVHAASATYTPRRNVASNDGSALLSDKLLLLLSWIPAIEDKQSKFQNAASARRGK